MPCVTNEYTNYWFTRVGQKLTHRLAKKSLTSVRLPPERQIELSLLCIKSSITEMPNDSLAKTESQGRKKFLFSTVTKQSVCRLLASSSTGLSLKHGDIEDLRKRQKKWTQDHLTAVCSKRRACSGVRAHTHTKLAGWCLNFEPLHACPRQESEHYAQLQ